MDTGALAGNFFLRQVVVDLCLTSDVITSLIPVTVCSGLDNHCIDIYDSITLKLSYFCSILNNYASFVIQALILENSQLKYSYNSCFQSISFVTETNGTQVYSNSIGYDLLLLYFCFAASLYALWLST